MRDGVIVVTGASRGIGAAIARALAADGWCIAGLSRSGTTATGEGYACDMTDEAAIGSVIRRIASRERLVGLVNNAGQHEEAPSHELSAGDFERLMRLNATSVLVASREAYPHLRAANGGLIVNIGSFFDKLGVAQQRCLLRFEGGRRRHHALPCRGMGARCHTGAECGARLHRDRSQPQFSRRRQGQALAGAAHSSCSPRAAGRGGAAGRVAVHRPKSASSPERPSISTAAKA